MASRECVEDVFEIRSECVVMQKSNRSGLVTKKQWKEMRSQLRHFSTKADLPEVGSLFNYV